MDLLVYPRIDDWKVNFTNSSLKMNQHLKYKCFTMFSEKRYKKLCCIKSSYRSKYQTKGERSSIVLSLSDVQMALYGPGPSHLSSLFSPSGLNVIDEWWKEQAIHIDCHGYPVVFRISQISILHSCKSLRCREWNISSSTTIKILLSKIIVNKDIILLKTKQLQENFFY